MRTALNKKGLLGRQTHLLRRLHQDRMANEFVYTITIGHRLSSINDRAGLGKLDRCISGKAAL
ncbi:MAG: hypothetical protein QME44_02635, partial [Thermodesulfobacteriota bacterium]|nr:hypothetical protein [Thermodesulfobacteriota bacterium]